MKIKVLLLLTSVSLLSACLKVEVKDVVADTVDAGKELYTTVKRKQNGEEERLYSHSVFSEDESDDIDNIAKCNTQVKSMIQGEELELRKVLSQSSEVYMLGEYRNVKCQLTVLVR